MKPIASFPAETARGLVAVLTDIDDTLTEHGRLPADAYGALEALRASGLLVIPVTGRPAGWCDLIARQWPVDGVVGENGAVAFRYDEASRRMLRDYAKPEADRLADQARLEVIRAEVLASVPGAAVSGDQPYREADLAIDFCEDVPALGAAAVAKIVAIFQRHGAVAKVSSIHVNGWFGAYDKLTTSRLFLSERFGIDIDAARDRIVFFGDSPNDAPMFGFFPNAIGVANVLDFEATIPARPRWITQGRGATGFVEAANRLLALRGTAPVT
jgi:HAD superfamily hydrolase (TIGR01484 family)